MKKAVLKYVLKEEKKQILFLPKQTKFLKAALRKAGVCVWALTEIESSEKENFEFILMTTGEIFLEEDLSATHIDSFFNGSYVFHLFVKRYEGVNKLV